MVDYAVEIAALDAAIATGATEVKYDNGRSVRYDSFEALLSRRRFLLGLQDAATTTPSTTGRRSAVASFDRGDC